MAPKEPYTYTPERIEEIRAAMDAYAESASIPILAEFAFNFGLSNTQCFYENPDLIEARKRLFLKKEAQLEKGALSGQINCTMAIFSLKQIGWKDKVETETRLGGIEGEPAPSIKIEFIDAPARPVS